MFVVFSFYQVLVEGESSGRSRRELAVPGCFPAAGGYEEAEIEGATSYVGAELPPSELPRDTPFIVGDNRSYGGYWNPPLDPRKGYLIYLQAASHHRGVSLSDKCELILVIVIQKEGLFMHRYLEYV